MNPSLGMMLALISDVIDHPGQIASCETDDAIASLPLEQLATSEFPVDVMTAPTFELADEITNKQRGRNAQGEMHVVLDAADFMDEGAGRLDDSFSQASIGEALDLGC